MTPLYKNPVCRGSWALGTACGKCERCVETNPNKSKHMTTNEREIAIREGHKIYAETSYFTPRPQLDFENARHVFCEGFDRGYIAATTEANKRIASLESEVANLHLNIKAQEQLGYELQASNSNLREVLLKTQDNLSQLAHHGMEQWAKDEANKAYELIEKALSATPAESLQAHDDELLERAAKLCDRFIKQEHGDGNSATAIMLIQDEIRALKEVK